MDKILQLFKILPKWARILMAALIGIGVGLALFFSSTSCSVVRASIDGTGRLSTTVNQSVADSLNISVNFTR